MKNHSWYLNASMEKIFTIQTTRTITNIWENYECTFNGKECVYNCIYISIDGRQSYFIEKGSLKNVKQRVAILFVLNDYIYKYIYI